MRPLAFCVFPDPAAELALLRSISTPLRVLQRNSLSLPRLLTLLQTEVLLTTRPSKETYGRARRETRKGSRKKEADSSHCWLSYQPNFPRGKPRSEP